MQLGLFWAASLSWTTWIDSKAYSSSLYNAVAAHDCSSLLAFANLYPTSKEALAALHEVWALLYERSANEAEIKLLSKAIPGLLSLTQASCTPCQIDREPALAIVETAGIHLGHRKLLGHTIQTISQIFTLESQDIDIARALLLTELGEDIGAIRHYETLLDLWALQIKANLAPQAKAGAIIEAINEWLFAKQGFCFPPASRYLWRVDQYSSLHSVIDGRQGICLGVSLLYLCLAQRLNLPLEIITPPGHIFLRYRQGDTCINIETTADGIHIDDEEYLGFTLTQLPTRTLKEVLGMAHYNRAATWLLKQEYAKGLAEYQTAAHYLPEEPLLLELTALCHLLLANQKEALPLLQRAQKIDTPIYLSASTLAEDLLQGAVDAAGVLFLYLPSDATRPALEAYRKGLEELITKYPRFRAGWLQLAHTYLELKHTGLALQALQKYDNLDNSHVEVQSMLAQLALERYDYSAAWLYWQRTANLCSAKNCLPKSLHTLRCSLMLRCAPPRIL